MSDAIDKAIAAAEEPPRVVLVQCNIQISSTGRPVIMQVPRDLTDAEVIELSAFVLLGLRAHVARVTGSTGSRLIVPGRA